VTNRQTDTLTDHTTPSVAIGRIAAMQPNNNNNKECIYNVEYYKSLS